MPPRHVYWTIIVDNQPTAFRAADRDELLPTLNRLKERHPSAVLRWFERGRLWESREEAREALRAADAAPKESRGKSWRRGGDHRDPREKYQLAKKAKWARLKERWRGGPSDRVAREDRPGPEGRWRRDDRDRRQSERPKGPGGWKPKGPDSRPSGGSGWKPKGPGGRPSSGSTWRPKAPGAGRRPPSRDGRKRTGGGGSGRGGGGGRGGAR
jgi:hypothetical protein